MKKFKIGDIIYKKYWNNTVIIKKIIAIGTYNYDMEILHSSEDILFSKLESNDSNYIDNVYHIMTDELKAQYL